MIDDVVSPDGSPLPVYLALPPDGTPLLVHAQVGPGASLLELGSGPGRTTRVLVALGHRVCAVDDSAEMLEHVTGAERVLADVYALDLGRRFDAVVGASHLVNTPGADTRRRLLDVGRRHLEPGGLMLLERYRPGWVAGAAAFEGSVGPVGLRFEPHRLDDGVLHASMTYELAGRRWRQDFTAEDVPDDLLAAEAAASGLRFDGRIDDDGAWVRLVAQ